MLNWMAWTQLTAIFFSVIAILIVAMTLWQQLQPTVPRKGYLPIVTTRGDRLFLGLLSSAFIHLGFIGWTEVPVVWVTLGAVIWIAVVMRWG